MHIYILPQCSTMAASVLNSAGMDAQFERSCCAILRGILILDLSISCRTCFLTCGFYYLQSRYYDPTVRRFLNADGIFGANQDLLSYNLFAYCSNDPVNFCDPTGCSLTPYERLRVLLASGKAWYDAQGKIHIPYSSYRFMSKKRTNRPDSGLADLPDEEISRRARDRSLSGPERNKYREEEKVRGLRNKQKRKNYKRIDKDITDPHYFDLEPYPG